MNKQNPLVVYSEAILFFSSRRRHTRSDRDWSSDVCSSDLTYPAGVRWAGYVLLRLPYEIKDLFTEWLAQHYPERAEHVMSLIRAMRGGRANDPNFGSRMRGTGPYALLLTNRFRIACPTLNLKPSE